VQRLIRGRRCVRCVRIDRAIISIISDQPFIGHQIRFDCIILDIFADIFADSEIRRSSTRSSRHFMTWKNVSRNQCDPIPKTSTRDKPRNRVVVVRDSRDSLRPVPHLPGSWGHRGEWDNHCSNKSEYPLALASPAINSRCPAIRFVFRKGDEF